MSLSQFEFWARLEAAIVEKRRALQGHIDSGALDHAALQRAIGQRQAYQLVRGMARDVYAEITGTARPAEPVEEDDDDIQL